MKQGEQINSTWTAKENTTVGEEENKEGISNISCRVRTYANATRGPPPPQVTVRIDSSRKHKC